MAASVASALCKVNAPIDSLPDPPPVAAGAVAAAAATLADGAGVELEREIVPLVGPAAANVLPPDWPVSPDWAAGEATCGDTTGAETAS